MNFIIGVLASISAVFITIIAQYLYKLWKMRGLRTILDFLNDEVTFIYPPREEIPQHSILPRTATEDFLAINNVLSAFLEIGWKGIINLKSSKDFDNDDKKKNLVFICSPLSNHGTKELIDHIKKKYPCGIPNFQCDPKDKRCYMRVAGGKYESSTYDVVEECIKENTKPEEAEMYDHAILMKIKSPWENGKKILVLAGIRGIGTWGAAECLKKGWADIMSRKSSSKGKKKTGEFVAVIRVDFNNCDLTLKCFPKKKKNRLRACYVRQ